jgi:predicted AlkP superfamily pyrophosphatase or phosphodiesterase
MVEEIVRREGFGADDVPDLLFVNYKLIDEIGHLYSMNSPEMGDAIRAQDGDLPELIGFLNASIGTGEWVMALTADHGHTPSPAVSGASVISPGRVADAIVSRFDRDRDGRRIVQSVQPTQIYVDVDELHQQGATLTDVSRFVLTLTKREVGSDAWPIAADALDDPAFLAAFPSTWLDELACAPRD